MVFDHIWIYLMVKTQMISDMRWEQIGIAKHDPKSSWLHMHTTTCIDIPDVQFLWTCQDDHGSAQVQMASAHEQSPHPSVFVVGQFSILLARLFEHLWNFQKKGIRVQLPALILARSFPVLCPYHLSGARLPLARLGRKDIMMKLRSLDQHIHAQILQYGCGKPV